MFPLNAQKNNPTSPANQLSGSTTWVFDLRLVFEAYDSPHCEGLPVTAMACTSLEALQLPSLRRL
jgi:hypothetical protein